MNISEMAAVQGEAQAAFCLTEGQLWHREGG